MAAKKLVVKINMAGWKTEWREALFFQQQKSSKASNEMMAIFDDM